MLSLSSRFVSMPSLSARIIVVIGIVLTILIVVAIVVIIVIYVVRGGASSIVSASCPPRRQRPPCFWPFWQGRVRMKETFYELIPVAFIVCLVNPVSQGSELINVDGVNIFK